VEATAFSLRYRLSRSELWRAYWLKWRLERGRRYLKQALGLAASVGLFFLVEKTPYLIAAPFLLGVVPAYVVFVTLSTLLASQALYSGTTRELHMDRDGWRATRGDEADECAWRDVYSVIDGGGMLLITGNQGDFLAIPVAAFRDPHERSEVVAACMQWHRRGHGL